jgi:hypothetical protein
MAPANETNTTARKGSLKHDGATGETPVTASTSAAASPPSAAGTVAAAADLVAPSCSSSSTSTAATCEQRQQRHSQTDQGGRGAGAAHAGGDPDLGALAAAARRLRLRLRRLGPRRLVRGRRRRGLALLVVRRRALRLVSTIRIGGGTRERDDGGRKGKGTCTWYSTISIWLNHMYCTCTCTWYSGPWHI